MANPSDELLARFLAGECDDLERADIARWVAGDPARQHELDRLRVVFDLERAPYSAKSTPAVAWDLDRARARVNARIDAQNDAQNIAPIDIAPSIAAGRQRISSGISWSRQPAFRIAAALVITIGLAATWKVWQATGPSSTPAAATGMQQQYATTIGEQRDIRLPDSTRVILAPATTLIVAADYGSGSRTVTLEGEAWFDVRHDEQQPFEVHAHGTVTRDIGTVFLVRAFPADTVIRVTVTEGQASLRAASAPANGAVVLSVDDVGILSTTSSTVRLQRSAPAGTGWRDGQLPFDDASLDEVVQELQRWYGAIFVLGNPALATRRLSATLPANDLAGALNVLGLALNVDIAHQGDTVTIR